MDSSRHSVVTGANRGLGLEFTRQLLARGDRVVAACRRPGEATALTALAGAFPGHLQVLPLTIDSERSRMSFAKEVASLLDQLDLLVNNAGVLASGERFGTLRAETLEQAFATNAAGPLLLTQALAPLLAKGRRPRVLNLGSEWGSVALLDEFRTPSYAISKAALNMAGALMARALNPQGIGVLTLSPGWVRTDMGGEQAPVSASEAVQSLLDVAERQRRLPAGDFLDCDGKRLPW
jgi:NAD(P)-dependent dehydrogenase (short-subunit alcohol dehydrogenase family)